MSADINNKLQSKNFTMNNGDSLCFYNTVEAMKSNHPHLHCVNDQGVTYLYDLSLLKQALPSQVYMLVTKRILKESDINLGYEMISHADLVKKKRLNLHLYYENRYIVYDEVTDKQVYHYIQLTALSVTEYNCDEYGTRTTTPPTKPKLFGQLPKTDYTCILGVK